MDRILKVWIADLMRFFGLVAFMDGMMEAFYFLELGVNWKAQPTVWILNVLGVLTFALGSWIYHNVSSSS